MTGLLIPSYPLQVIPELAEAIGLNEAIMLQQIHYWMRYAKVEHDGHMWVYKTYEEWKKKDFPFWSISTIKRTAKNLQDLNLLLVEKLSSNSFDRVNHYTVNYKAIEELSIKTRSKPDTDDSVKVNSSNVDNSTMEDTKVNPSDSVNMSRSDSVNMSRCLREQKDITKETTDVVVETDFDDFLPIAKAKLIRAGVIPAFAVYDDVYFKPEIFNFCEWFARRNLNSNERNYKLVEWFTKFTPEERQKFYITEQPTHASYKQFEPENEEMTLEEQRQALIESKRRAAS